MNQNPIDEVLQELNFTKQQKEGFWNFIKYAKVCQETGNNTQLKSQLDEIIKNLSK